MSGPLQGIRVIELAGIGPGPFAGMLLSDLGAEVIRVERPGAMSPPADVLARGRRSIAVNLKQPEGLAVVLKLVEGAQVLIEGYRPGVAEKLGLGPEHCHARNPALVYGRMTGWGQNGSLAQAAGHDINYIALTGALDAIGRKDSGPVPPLNLLGDFGGGSLYLVMGVLAAVIEAQRSGKGQVVDAAITDGVISLSSAIFGFRAMGMWNGPRQSNLLDGGAPFYDTYQCADGHWISIGSIEPQFYALLMEKLGVDLGEAGFAQQFDQSRWPEYKARLAETFASRDRDHWCQLLEGTDVCFAPVLSYAEAAEHPHNRERGSFVERDGVLQSAPAPRLSRTPGTIQRSPVAAGTDTRDILAELGYGADEQKQLLDAGAVAEAQGN